MPVQKTVTAYYDHCGFCKIRPVYQYDYGRTLLLEGFGDLLPTTYEVHFSNDRQGGKATTMLGNRKTGVPIPDIYLVKGVDVWAWLYLHDGSESGMTVYTIQIPVLRRPGVSNDPPTEVQQSAYDQAIRLAEQVKEDYETLMAENRPYFEFADQFMNGMVTIDDGDGSDIPDTWEEEENLDGGEEDG